MSPKTVTKPPTDKHLWRLLLARTHPDQGGSGELFIWAHALRELVCGAENPPYHQSYGTGAQHDNGRGDRAGGERPEPERIPFDWADDFDDLTMRAMTLSREVDEPYARLLCMLADCESAHLGPMLAQQQRGASYKQLALIAHRAGMSKEERVKWYEVAAQVPLAQRHAGHIIARIQGEAAARGVREDSPPDVSLSRSPQSGAF